MLTLGLFPSPFAVLAEKSIPENRSKILCRDGGCWEVFFFLSWEHWVTSGLRWAKVNDHRNRTTMEGNLHTDRQHCTLSPFFSQLSFVVTVSSPLYITKPLSKRALFTWVLSQQSFLPQQPLHIYLNLLGRASTAEFEFWSAGTNGLSSIDK